MKRRPSPNTLGRLTFFVFSLVLWTMLSSSVLSRVGARAEKPATPKLVGITPDVVVSGSNPVTLHLHGTALAGLSKVTVLNCDRTHLDLPVKWEANKATLELPASLLSKVCVLRVSAGPNDGLPVGVADPQLAKLKVPAYDPDTSPGWGGMFNYVFGSAQPQLPNSDDATVGISFTNPMPQPVFILGKNGTSLFRLQVLAQKNNDESDKSTLSLWLPGVRPGDVQWGPKDVEDFWLGTLSIDGSQIVFRQALADMVQEPAGTPDQHRRATILQTLRRGGLEAALVGLERHSRGAR